MTSSNWERVKIKSVARLVTEKANDSNWKLGLENLESWTGRLATSTGDFEGEGVTFREGDVLFGKLRPYLAKAWVADRSGAAVGDFLVMRSNDRVLPNFLVKTFLSPERIDEISASAFGAKMPRVRWEMIRDLSLHLPSIQEQSNLLQFLDRETAEIDAFIADQKELIRLLTERRAATISHAVANGAGDPTNAQLLPLRRIITHLDQGWSPNCKSAPASEDDWGVLKVGCVNGGAFLPEENKALPPEEVPRPEYSVRGGDILLSRGNTRDLVGSAALVERDYPRLLLSDLLYRMRVDEGRASASYVALALGSRVVRGQIEASSKGTSASMQKISQTDVRELRLWMPPLDAQRQISTRIAGETAEIDAAIADAREAIGLSRERRAALISAAVTGKIDVRDGAA